MTAVQPRRLSWHLAEVVEVVPLMAIDRHRAGVGSDVPTRLLYSSRSFAEIIYREELEKLDARDHSLEVIHILTRSRPEGWDGYDRRIDAKMLEEVGPPLEEWPLTFVCGPTPLVKVLSLPTFLSAGNLGALRTLF